MTRRDKISRFLTTGKGRYLLLAARVFLGALFVYAAYAKLHFDGRWHLGDYRFFFAMTINSYQMLPNAMVDLMARILPWLELALGVLLLAGVALRWVSVVASALLLVFIGGMARAAILGLEINCGCFGNNEKLGPLTLLRDSTLLFLALAITAGAFLSHRASRRREPRPSQSVVTQDAGSAHL